MKNIIKAVLLITMSLFFNNSTAQNAPGIPWYYHSPSDTLVSTGIDSAYQLLTNIYPDEVVVAVIDAGTDISHKDLQNNLWTNTDEIAGNGIDDDHNGYVDDIHGWNFLGNQAGENIQGAPYEYVRIYDTLSEKYDSLQLEKTKPGQNPELDLYREISQLYHSELEYYRKSLKYYDKILQSYSEATRILNNHFDDKEYTYEDIITIDADSERRDIKWAVKLYTTLKERGLEREYVESRVRVIQSILKSKLNPDYKPRKIIGDDVTNINDSIYGNNDLNGGTASHGTAVAGIIGASQDNSFGIDGISPNVKIMPIRAVPGGDEWDKDIALAIRYAVNNGADIINGSFGKRYSPYKHFVDSAIKYAEKNDVLIVLGAGNDQKNNDIKPNYPNKYYSNDKEARNVIVVGASTKYPGKGMVADFSNYGKNQVDLFAPGVDIQALNTNNRTRKISGTSAAAPVVSGIAALIKAYYPEIPAGILKEVIMKSTKKYPSVHVRVPGNKYAELPFFYFCKTSGIVNAYYAIALTKEYYRAGRF